MTGIPRSIGNRAFVALVAGIGYALLALLLLRSRGPSAQGGDFTYAYFNARSLMHGIDPFRAVRRGDVPFGAVMFYPLTTGLIALPLVWLPAKIGAIVFAGIGAACIAYVLTRHDWWKLLVLASGPAYAAAASVQWSPLLTASALCPALLWLTLAKPNLGAPLLAWQSFDAVPRRGVLIATLVGLGIILMSLLVAPGWPLEWLAIVRHGPESQQHIIPLATWYGLPLLMAAVRLRRPEARLLLVLACVPQNAFFYDQLPLMLVARRRLEMVALCVVSLAAWFAAFNLEPFHGSLAELSHRWTPYLMVGVYWPCLILVLARRDA